MIDILTWVSIFAGGILLLMLLLSIIGGLDVDLDVEIGSTDVETDAGGFGLVKGILVFTAVGAWVMKMLLEGEQHTGVVIVIGLISGFLAFLLLNYLLKLLLKNEENVNWSVNDAIYQKGEVYLKIPANEGNGLVHVNVKGALRELKAKSIDETEIKTGAAVLVVDVDGEFVLVKEDVE